MRKIKLWCLSNHYDIAIIAIIVLVGAGAFGLGRLSTQQETTTSSSVQIVGNVLEMDAYAVRAEDESKGKYVASRNGTKYYPVSCSSANRIHDENRVYFQSSQEAILAGYEASSSCN